MPSSRNSRISDDESTEPRNPASLPYPEDAPMEDRYSSEEPSEEEIEEETEEETEEEPLEIDPASPRPTSPIEESQRIPPFTIFRRHSGAPWTTRGPRPRMTPRMSVRGSQTISFTAPLDDPYRPPSVRTNPGHLCLGATLDRWRRKYGNPFANIPETPSQAQTLPCPVTGEPPHLTIPLLVMRLDDQETEIDQIKDNLEAIPSPEVIEDIQTNVESQGLTIQELRVEIDQLRKYVMGLPKVTIDLEQMVFDVEKKMDTLWTRSRAQSETIAVLSQEMARTSL